MSETLPSDNLLMKNSLFSVKLEVSVRNFSRQTSGSRPDPVKINGDTVSEWIHNLWNYTEKYLKRKVIFVNNIPEWDMNIHPDECDLKEFVTFNDKKSKTIHRLPDVTSTLLQNWKTKNILLIIHQYSTNVGTQDLYKIVQDVLIKPFEKDRSNAISNAALNDIVTELKRIHEYHYISHDINYLTWASYIASQDAHLRESLLNSPPPASIIELFRFAPMHSDRVIHDIRRNVGIANSLNCDYSDELSELSALFEKLSSVREQETIILKTIDSKLSAMKDRTTSRSSILNALHEEVRPEENGLSEEAIRRITPQDDIDHI